MPKLIFFGCGAVGCGFLELTKLLPVKNYENMVIIDPRNIFENQIVKEFENRINFVNVKITEKNLLFLLRKYARKNDIILDISYNIYFKPILKWCMQKDVMYINTSMEKWPLENEHILGDREKMKMRTIQHMHNIARKINKKDSATIVLEHGMNPGLVSHFTKNAIKKIAKEVLEKRKNLILEKALENNNFAKMAQLLNLRVIHCSEKDTQKTNLIRLENEFMNTWGAYSFYGEGVDPAQVSLGTHENYRFNPSIEQIFFPKRGIDVLMESFVPNEKIKGMLIPHGETETLNKFLTVKENGKIIYSPSSYYVYSPCQEAWNSLESVRKNNYEMLEKQKVLKGNEIISGKDTVGALLIFENDPRETEFEKSIPVSYWSGTILDNNKVKKLGINYTSSTILQVAISLNCAIKWMIKNNRKGICFPEDLDSEEILEKSVPWLGTIFSDWVPYFPKSTKIEYFDCDETLKNF